VLEDRIALSYSHVTSADGTVLQVWSNDPAGTTAPADRPTVLLCNGLGTNPYAWPALLDPACEVRVVSWSHRGVGGSQRPADAKAVTIEVFAEDAVAVMDHHGLDSAVLMGWSMGVNTMFEVAVRHPDRVRGLFAVGGVPGDTFGSMLSPLQLPRLLRKQVMVAAARTARVVGKGVTPVTSHLPVGPRLIGMLSHTGFMLPLSDPELGQRAVQEFLSTPIEWYAHLALHSSLHARVSLSAISVPSAFVAGTYDLLASAHDMRTAAERIPGASYRLLRGSHFLPLEQPAAVHDELLDLLARVAAAGG
jgi:pimeloyl-ACP methyl ester carboxylesterase